MSVESDLTSLLNTGTGDSRHYWRRHPQGTPTYPYDVWHKITGIRDYAMDGANGYVFSRYQADVFAPTTDAAITRSLALIAVLSGYRGTTGGTRFLGIFVEGESDLDALEPGEVSDLHRRRIDFLVHHDE